MRFFLLFFLVGVAFSKPVHDALEFEEEAVLSLLEHDCFLRELDTVLKAETDEEPKTELGKNLEEKLNELLRKIKDGIDQEQIVNEELMEKATELWKRMKELKVKIGEETKELIKQVKDKINDLLQTLWENLKDKDENELLKRSDEDGGALSKTLNDILEKIKDAIENGKTVRQELVDKAADVLRKFKEKGLKIGEKTKEIIQTIREKAKDAVDSFLEKLGLRDRKKRVFNKIREGLEKLLEELKLQQQNFNLEDLIAKVNEILGKKTELAKQFIKNLKEKGEEYLQNLINTVKKILGKEKKRSVKDVWEKIKNYFKELNIGIKENLVKFGEWAKEKAGHVMDKTKSAKENVKALAKEFISKSKELSKEVGTEALEFFRLHKEDLEEKWEDVKKSVKEILQRAE